jgi:hypothetical protein
MESPRPVSIIGLFGLRWPEGKKAQKVLVGLAELRYCFRHRADSGGLGNAVRITDRNVDLDCIINRVMIS